MKYLDAFRTLAKHRKDEIVVTSAGNDGPQRMLYAPASDPFVITVGAADIMDTLGASDDVAAPWSAWGTTLDGFAKPELSDERM